LEAIGIAMNVVFSGAAHRFLVADGRASQFAVVAAHGIPAGAAIAGSSLKEYMAKTLGDIPDYEILLAPSEEWWGESLRATAADVAATAVLVLKHGALDELLNSLCRIIGTISFPAIAEKKLGNRKITIAEALDEKRKLAALSDRVQKFINALERSSVMQKIEFLWEFAGPPPEDKRGYGGLSYDSEHLKACDERRHKAVHGGIVKGLAAHQEADSKCLFEVGMLVLIRFHRATGLTVSGKSPGLE
jgi:hypothetical protein